MPVYDLSHPIKSDGSCTYVRTDTKPTATFQEGDSHGYFFVTSSLHNLPSNLCTHIDFPGHVLVDGVKPKLVGEYDVDRFVGNVAILDFRHKMNAVRRYFNDDGIINIDVSDPAPWGSFIDTFKSLEVSLQELMAALNEFRLESLKGVLFLCGNAGYWKPGKYLAHQYIYFYNIYLTEEAVRWLAKQEIAFVGIDAFQLEDPIINFRGDEAFVARDPSLRRFLLAKLEAKTLFCNHSTLLSNDIVIYENLNLSESLAGKKGWFSGAPLNLQLPGVNDNGLCRPVLTTERSDR